MSFSFMVNGHAGNGMSGNSPEEIEAVRAVAAAVLQAGKEHNLNISLRSFSPPDWAPEVTDA